MGYFDGDPLENLLGWAEPDLNATVEGRWLFVPDEYPDVVGYTDGIFILMRTRWSFLIEDRSAD